MFIHMSPHPRAPHLRSDRVCIILTCSLGILHSMPQCWQRRWSNMMQQHGMPAVAASSAYRGDVHTHCYFADCACAAFASKLYLVPACRLVNTGWTSGSYGEGHRIELRHTRAIIDAIHSGELLAAEYDVTPVFHLQVCCLPAPSQFHVHDAESSYTSQQCTEHSSACF